MIQKIDGEFDLVHDGPWFRDYRLHRMMWHSTGAPISGVFSSELLYWFTKEPLCLCQPLWCAILEMKISLLLMLQMTRIFSWRTVGTLRSVSFRWNFVQPGTGQKAQVKGGHESTLLPPMDESCWHALLDQSSKKATWHGKIYHRSMKPMVGPYSLQTNWSRIQADVSHLLVTCLGDPERSKQPPVMATQGWKLSILLLFFPHSP